MPELTGGSESASSPPRIELRWPVADIAHVVLLGEHDLGNGEQLEEVVRSVVDVVSHLIVDLSEIEFIDTTVINGLCRAKRQADLRALSFNVVIGGNEIVARALEVTNLAAALHAVETLDAALEPRPSV